VRRIDPIANRPLSVCGFRVVRTRSELVIRALAHIVAYGIAPGHQASMKSFYGDDISSMRTKLAQYHCK
jgi:hypothetical protein